MWEASFSINYAPQVKLLRAPQELRHEAPHESSHESSHESPNKLISTYDTLPKWYVSRVELEAKAHQLLCDVVSRDVCDQDQLWMVKRVLSPADALSVVAYLLAVMAIGLFLLFSARRQRHHQQRHRRSATKRRSPQRSLDFDAISRDFNAQSESHSWASESSKCSSGEPHERRNQQFSRDHPEVADTIMDRFFRDVQQHLDHRWLDGTSEHSASTIEGDQQWTSW